MFFVCIPKKSYCDVFLWTAGFGLAATSSAPSFMVITNGLAAYDTGVPWNWKSVSSFGISFLGIAADMVKSISERLASISSELPASCSLLGDSIVITCATICSGFPLSAVHTFSASSGVHSERTICHSAKLISSTFLVLTSAAACSAGVGGTYFVIVKPAGGKGVVAAIASSSVHPWSL